MFGPTATVASTGAAAFSATTFVPFPRTRTMRDRNCFFPALPATRYGPAATFTL